MTTIAVIMLSSSVRPAYLSHGSKCAWKARAEATESITNAMEAIDTDVAALVTVASTKPSVQNARLLVMHSNGVPSLTPNADSTHVVSSRDAQQLTAHPINPAASMASAATCSRLVSACATEMNCSAWTVRAHVGYFRTTVTKCRHLCKRRRFSENSDSSAH